MKKYVLEHLIDAGEEILFDTENEAVKYAVSCGSDCVVVEIDISADQLSKYKTGAPIPCTTYRREIWHN